jgi:hypothetical protein
VLDSGAHRRGYLDEGRGEGESRGLQVQAVVWTFLHPEHLEYQGLFDFLGQQCRNLDEGEMCEL